MNCVFCKIVSGHIPSPRIFEDDSVVVIRDLHPQAKTHFLVIPKLHVESLVELFDGDDQNGRTQMGMLFSAATKVAKIEGFSAEGFRTVINTGLNGGQSVFHLHLHLLGGEKLQGTFA